VAPGFALNLGHPQRLAGESAAAARLAPPACTSREARAGYPGKDTTWGLIGALAALGRTASGRVAIVLH